MGKKYSKKQIRKLADKKCYFCECDEYALLDVHRIVPGSQGGTYKSDYNMLTVCATCHRKIHANLIQILGRHRSTLGRYVLHYIDENGMEQIK